MESTIRTVLSTYAGSDSQRASQIVSPETLEYGALKQEQQTRLILRDTALYITVGGLLTAASVLSAATPSSAAKLAGFFSYAAPAFSLSMFLIYFRSDYYLSAARRYIVRELGPRIMDHFALVVGATLEDAKLKSNFGWESYHRRPRLLWLLMKLTSTLVVLAVFLAPIALSYLFSVDAAGVPLTGSAQLLAAVTSVLIVLGCIRLALFD